MRGILAGRATAAAALLAAVFAVGAPARTAADDVSVQVFLESGNLMSKTTGLEFRIVVEVESTSGTEQGVTIRIALPDGLRWGNDGPDPAEGCTGTDPAVCSTRMTANPVGTIAAGYVWDVVAERPGTFEITAGVEPTEADPDLANNSDTFRFEVVAAAGGGGGSTASAIASAAKLSPAKPKAGSSVTAIVRVTAAGAPVTPSRVGCAASIGATELKGVARATRGSATCTFRTPRSARGKVVRGSVAFTARGARFTKRFSAKLG